MIPALNGETRLHNTVRDSRSDLTPIVYESKIPNKYRQAGLFKEDVCENSLTITMSFEKSRRYSRPVLHPISLPPQSSDSSHHDARVQIGPQSHGDSWVVTTHTFLGTTNRVNPACWPSYRFHDDPAGIPDNDALHTCYQSESARSRGPEHEYHMFDENYQDDDQEVQPPRFAVKRYAPPKTREGGLTLFVMPGMHVPTEVCCEAYLRTWFRGMVLCKTLTLAFP